MRKVLTKNFWNIEVWAVQKHVNLVDLVKSFPTNIFLQNLASIQKRTSPVKFAHLAEKSGKGSISNLSTKARNPWSSTRRPWRTRWSPARSVTLKQFHRESTLIYPVENGHRGKSTEKGRLINISAKNRRYFYWFFRKNIIEASRGKYQFLSDSVIFLLNFSK